MNILVVEDSEDTAQLIKAYLRDHNITLIKTIKEAKKELALKDYHLMLLDIELPDGSGFDFCTEITKNQDLLEMSTIMLTAKSTTEEKVAGLYCGADDYITKPFSGQELRARVDACLRRHKKSSQHLVYKYGFHLDIERQKAFRVVKNSSSQNTENQDLNLTPTEFRIFMTLIKDPEKAHSRQTLMKAVWASGLNIEKRGIDTHISHLRKKLDKDSKSIISIYGKGYSFNINGLNSKASHPEGTENPNQEEIEGKKEENFNKNPSESSLETLKKDEIEEKKEENFNKNPSDSSLETLKQDEVEEKKVEAI